MQAFIFFYFCISSIRVLIFSFTAFTLFWELSFTLLGIFWSDFLVVTAHSRRRKLVKTGKNHRFWSPRRTQLSTFSLGLAPHWYIHGIDQSGIRVYVRSRKEASRSSIHEVFIGYTLFENTFKKSFFRLFSSLNLEKGAIEFLLITW